MIKRVLAVCALAIATWAQNPSSGNIIVVGNEAQPVQFTHKQNIQAAINKAGPSGFVIIPADYPFPAETYTNPNNIVIFDLRNNSLNIVASAFTVNGLPAAGSGCVPNPNDNGCAVAGSPSFDVFIGSVGNGTGWLLQLLASGFNIKVPVNVNSGNIAGIINLGFNPDPGLGSGIGIVAPASGTPYNIYLPGAASSGYLQCTNVANKVTCTWEPAIILTSDVTGVLPLQNGGTNATTQSGAILNIFPTPIRAGDIVRFDGTNWSTFGGNTGGGGSTGIFTENGTGNPGWIQSPIPVLNGGWGLTTLTPNAIYKGNGTSAPQVSALSDNGSNVITTEIISDQTMGYNTSAMSQQTSATPTNITAMTWNIFANKRYKLECVIPVTGTASSTIAFDLNGPGSPTSYTLDAFIGAFSSDKVIAGANAWGTATPASGVIGVATVAVRVEAQIQNGATASGTALTLRTIADGTHGITVLADAACRLTQQN